MSALQYPALQEQLDYLFSLYNAHIVPRLTKKNKTIGIGAAVAISVIYLIREKLLKPPKKLRHIPYLGIGSKMRTLFGKETLWDRARRVTLPLTDAPGSKGLHLEPGGIAWELIVTNPEDAKKVLLKHDLFPKYPIPLDIKELLISKFIGGPNIAMINGHEWKNQRKLANPAFHRAAPVKLFGQLTQQLFQVIDESISTPANVSDLMARFTLEAIGRAGFGFKFNAILDKDNDWVNTYNDFSKAVGDPLFFVFPIFDMQLRWLFPARHKAHRQLDKFLNMLDAVIVHKRDMIAQGVKNETLEENEKDLLTLLIEAEQKGEGAMSNEELKSNLCIFFLAGHDTTASALAFAIHYLAQNPEIQEKARAEAISILGDEPLDVLPTLEETRQMKYINQIMKETLRMSGPIPHVFPRIAKEDTELSGVFVPKGTMVKVNMFEIHHSKKLWQDPEVFNPDRFADEDSTRSGDNYSWIPFGGGPRLCIGMNLSFSEQRVMLSMLLRKYTWETPADSKHKERVQPSGFVTVTPDNLDINFRRRY